MKDYITAAIDARQTPYWGKYLESLGWQTKKIGKTYVSLRVLPLTKFSMIKIQHAQGPLPFKVIDTLAQKNNALAVIIEPHSYGYTEKEYIQNGYVPSKMRFTHTATIKIDLKQSEKSLLKSFSENARRNIKKAKTYGLEIKMVNIAKDKDKTFLHAFYGLLSNLSKMKNFYIPSILEYENKMRAFGNKSFFLFAYEKNQEKPIAVVWFGIFANVLAYFQTGITKRGYAVLANYLLVEKGLQIGKKMGLSVFDFESIYDPRFPKDKRSYIKYTDFKKRFHGEIISYPAPWIKCYHPFFRFIYSLATVFS